MAGFTQESCFRSAAWLVRYLGKSRRLKRAAPHSLGKGDETRQTAGILLAVRRQPGVGGGETNCSGQAGVAENRMFLVVKGT